MQKLVAPLFDAIMYCHDMGIVHRDLKPENLLLTAPKLEDATLKIADFGLARYVSEEEMAKTVAGTPGYIAPEILQQKPYDHRCDYWSLGVVLFLLLSGALPFEHPDHIECFALIMKGKFSFESDTW